MTPDRREREVSHTQKKRGEGKRLPPGGPGPKGKNEGTLERLTGTPDRITRGQTPHRKLNYHTDQQTVGVDALQPSKKGRRLPSLLNT